MPVVTVCSAGRASEVRLDARLTAYVRLYRPSRGEVVVPETLKLDGKEVKRRAGRFVEKVGAEVSARDEKTGREVTLFGASTVLELKALTMTVLSGQGEGGAEVRRYFVGKSPRVEDPRTGEGTPRVKDVMRGEIDLFIAAWITRPPDSVE